MSRALRSGRVWIIEGMGILMWMGLAYACLKIGRVSSLRLSALGILSIFLVYLAAFLLRTELRVFRRDRLAKARVGRRAYKVRHREPKEWVPDAAIVLLLFLALVGWNAVMLQWLPDALPGNLEWIEAILAWLLFVILWLPLAAAALLGDGSLWRPAVRAWSRPGYWAGTLASAAVCWFSFFALLDGSGLIHWLEGTARLTGAGVATLLLMYAILLGTWLMIAALVEEAIAAPERRSLEDTWD